MPIFFSFDFSLAPPVHPRNSSRSYHQNAPVVTSSTGFVASEATTPTSGAPLGCRLAELAKEPHSIDEVISSNELINHCLNTRNSHFNHSGVIYSNAQSESIQTNSSYDTVRPINLSPANLRSNFLVSRPSLPLETSVNDDQISHVHYPRHHSCEENYSQPTSEYRKLSLINGSSQFIGDNNSNNNAQEHFSPSRLTPSPIIFSPVSDRSDNNSTAIPPSLLENHQNIIASPIIPPSTTTSSNNSDVDPIHRSDGQQENSRSVSPICSSLLLPPPVPWNLDLTTSENYDNKPFGLLSPTHHLDFDSFGVSEMTNSNTYAFSTFDSDCLAWMRLSIYDVTNHLTEDMNNSSELQLPNLDTLSRPCVHHWVDIFNSNPLGLRLNFVDDSCRLAGTLRIYINLIKPVKMSLRRTLDMFPSSATASPEPNSPTKVNLNESGDENNAVPTPPRLVSFFLPRGTSKVVYVTSSTTSANAIQSLLDRFHIQESARKFALYEHTLEGSSISARKLSTTECPLLLLLNWVRISTNREQFLELLKQKRIVLQENDTCDIEAEIHNTLDILPVYNLFVSMGKE
ncbi:putative rassf [Schistosoma mansoni]|uniref:putative rassf n=1 Tax=Schistosoma mansoni TaxID=6183 RepID=UPI00022DC4D3|nr:putative rassf [Schistosoma mansoni]|eukprot:XP_018652149.1 putative rassf [Schistosoma mansoni]